MADYVVERLILSGFDGRTNGVVIAKRTYKIGEDRVVRPAEEQDPVRFVDELYEGDDPAASPVLYEADTAPFKGRTDIVVIGTAYAPQGAPTQAFDVSVAVGRFRRTLRVFGPRHALWQPPVKETRRETIYRPPLFSDPTPVSRVPIDFAHAYGGIARYRVLDSDEIIEIPCPCNPFGRGYCVQNSREGLDGLELPQVEDLSCLLTPETLVRELGAVETLPIPGGFGFYGRSWYPRVSYFGVMPQDVERARQQAREVAKGLDPAKDKETIAALMSFEPPVMKPEFFQGAAPSMAVPYLDGDEPVSLINLSPSGLLAFNLPGRVPLVYVDRGDGWRMIQMALDTLVIVADEMKVITTYRGCVPATDDFLTMPLEVKDGSIAEYRDILAEKR